MNYTSKTTHKSDVMPTVSFTLKKLSHGRRLKIDLALADHRAKVRELSQEFMTIAEDDSSEARLRKIRLDSQTRFVIEEHFKPTYLREALDKLEGLEIDGAPATLENLFSDGPVELIEEIYQTIQNNIGLTLDEIKNSERPTTSAE